MTFRSLCTLVGLIATTMWAVGCSDAPSDAAGSGAEATAEPSASASSEPVSPLVGTWTRTTTCQELVGVLEDAGLEDAVPASVAGNGFVSGTPKQLAARDDVCEGAVPREHSHFFTGWGAFGSLDWNGNQVDDGTYELVDERTFMIGDATFNFEIEGDTMQLEPVLPDDCSKAACDWMVTVAYPGLTWERTD